MHRAGSWSALLASLRLVQGPAELPAYFFFFAAFLAFLAFLAFFAFFAI
jgi:hypothetical protein